MEITASMKKFATALFFYLSLTACGGGGSESTSPSNPVISTPSNVAPIADAGQDQNLAFGAYTPGLTINLLGTASDSDGTVQSIKWENTTSVAGQEAIELVDSDKLSASFAFNNRNITQEQVYTFSLTITDDDGATASDEISVTIAPYTPIDIKLPNNIHGARLVKLSEDQILVTGGCKKLLAELVDGQTNIYGCAEPSYQSFMLDLIDNSLTQVGDANFARPHPLSKQSTTLLNDGRVLLYSQDNGLAYSYNGTQWVFNSDEYYKHFGEIFDPNTQQFTPVESMSLMRKYAMPAVLTDDTVLFFAGIGRVDEYNNPHTHTIEAFNSETNSWSIMDASYPENYDQIITAILPDDKVLLVGGVSVGGGTTEKAYIYDHNAQTLVEIESIIPFINVVSNHLGGGAYQRLDLEDNSFCLISQNFSNDIIRFDPNTQTFNYDTEYCEQVRHVGQLTLSDGRLSNNGKVVSGAAYIEFKLDQRWITQEVVDIKNIPTQYNADGGYYEFLEPMTIRIMK